MFLHNFDTSEISLGWKFCCICNYILQYLWFSVFCVILDFGYCIMEFWDIAVYSMIHPYSPAKLFSVLCCALSTTTPFCNFIVLNITHCFKFQVLCLRYSNIPRYLLVQARFMVHGSWYFLHPHLNDKTSKDVLNTLLSRFSFHCCIIQRNTAYRWAWSYFRLVYDNL